MPKFKRKPDTRTFEVEQYGWPTSPHVKSAKGVCQCPEGDRRGHVHTMHEGQVVDLVDGDWVMPEPEEGKFYPIKDEVFRATYEPE